MSKWRNIPIENVEIDGADVNILIDTDEQGNNYIVIDRNKLELLLNPQGRNK